MDKLTGYGIQRLSQTVHMTSLFVCLLLPLPSNLFFLVNVPQLIAARQNKTKTLKTKKKEKKHRKTSKHTSKAK